MRTLGGAGLMPCAQGSLRVGVDQINRPVPYPLGLNREMGAQAGFAAAALLRV
jgi:hypothetical protein